MTRAEDSRRLYAKRRSQGRCYVCGVLASGARCDKHAAKAREAFKRYREKLLRDAGRR